MRRQRADARQARFMAGGGAMDDMINNSNPSEAPRPGASKPFPTSASTGTKRDFFGRLLLATSDDDDECCAESESAPGAGGTTKKETTTKKKKKITTTEQAKKEREARVWVSFHEGFSNAVRKPVTLGEIMSGL